MLARSFNWLIQETLSFIHCSLWRFQARPALQKMPQWFLVPNTEEALPLMVASAM